MPRLTYREQQSLDAVVKSLERECEESRWALSERALYEAKITALRAEKADLERRCAEEDAA